MDFFSKVEKWGNEHRPPGLDFIRIILGVFITYKGMLFTVNIDGLQSLIGEYDLVFASIAIAHYVIFAHVLGGALIVFGLFTRVVVAFQIPILIGAVFLVNYPTGFMSVGNHMELEVSIITLLLLIVLFIFGSGSISIDHMRRKEKQKADSEAGKVEEISTEEPDSEEKYI